MPPNNGEFMPVRNYYPFTRMQFFTVLCGIFMGCLVTGVLIAVFRDEVGSVTPLPSPPGLPISCHWKLDVLLCDTRICILS